MDYSLLVILLAVFIGLKLLKVSVKLIGILAVVAVIAGALHFAGVV